MLDYYDVRALFTEDEIRLQADTRESLEESAAPFINDWWEAGTFPKHLVEEFGSQGYFTIENQTSGRNPAHGSIGHGLIMYELERIDSALRSLVSVQTGLVMYPIQRYGSQDQKDCYLPMLAAGKIIGCFALTEEQGGSDPGSMATQAIRDGDHYVISGSKTWITNGNISDIALVWAKDETDTIRGFIVPTNSVGFEIKEISGKMSMRAAVTSELIFDEVRIHKTQMLPLAEGLRAPLSCLTQARYSIAWGALGALESVYSEASEFAKSRATFGKPIGSRQLVQAKLVRMLSDHTSGLLLAWRLAGLKDNRTMTYSQVSLAKRDNVRAALIAARNSREILGATGITVNRRTIRHMLNLETVDTYEGTYDIHTLILGRDILGLNALE